MDVDALVSEFGAPATVSQPVKSKAADTSNLDIDALVSEFGKPSTVTRSSTPSTITIRPPQPFTPAEEIEAAKPKANPRDSQLLEGIKNIPSNLGTNITNAATAGRDLASSGVEDISKPGLINKVKGAGEIGLGGLSALISPVTGGLKTFVEEPVTQLTGSPEIGDKAAFVVGSAIPIVPIAKAISKVAPKNSALRELVESIGPENIPSVVSQMKANPRLTPADLSPRVLQDTQHLFTVDGPHINRLSQAAENRTAGAKGAVQDIYDTSAGPSVDLVQKINDLAKASKDVGSKEINPAIAGAKPVSLQNTLTNLDNLLDPSKFKIGDEIPLTNIKRELNEIRKRLRGSKEYNAADLNTFQSNLRVKAEDLLRSADGGSKQMGQALMKVRNDLVDDIDKAAGGKYKPALSKYRDEMHIADAFKEGYQGIFSSSKAMENTPSFMKKWFDGLTDHEKQAAREGARASIATEIGVAKNPALAGEALSRSDFNREKLKILFGDAEANTLITRLEHERKIADTNNKLIHGAQTAMRSAAKPKFDMPAPSDPNKFVHPAIAEAIGIASTGTPGAGTLAYYGARGANKVKDAIKSKIQREKNIQYTKLALPNTSDERQALIDTLDRLSMPKPKQSIVRRGAGALAQVVKP